MKKILLLIFVGIQLANAATKDTIQGVNPFKKYYLFREEEDCDACGCSANGGSMGFSSMLNNNFIGIRYVYQQYTTKEGVFNNSPWITENFNTLQIWSRIPITNRIQLTALLPYHNNNRELITGKEAISGIGDLTFLGMYTLVQPKMDSTAVFTHKWQVGAGIKAPTGKYDQQNNGTLNSSFQLGTGSWDYLVATEYIIRRKSIGLNSALSYVYKTENQKQYQFGNQFNYGSTLFYFLDLDKIKLVPQLGFAGEVYAANKQVKQEVLDSKGSVLFSKFGLELGRKNLSVGINMMNPIKQNLTGGNVQAKYRIGFNFNYSL
ncbi:transporter family protein [Flavobacterium aciduliphilum]|uniref:Outer membrane beta-barrel porin/alpha-amylase n=1 Tax=Flavobacterium aciduliphilum TaxID=1101402 RepID=A0A328Y691_9FLAO|nr:transporter [Flavobacterium aciduliphilum]RAR69274.1 hypothetical protein CLV55_11812 [Flavobacterium aciduliphilum]